MSEQKDRKPRERRTYKQRIEERVRVRQGHVEAIAAIDDQIAALREEALVKSDALRAEVGE